MLDTTTNSCSSQQQLFTTRYSYGSSQQRSRIRFLLPRKAICCPGISQPSDPNLVTYRLRLSKVSGSEGDRPPVQEILFRWKQDEDTGPGLHYSPVHPEWQDRVQLPHQGVCCCSPVQAPGHPLHSGNRCVFSQDE